MNATRILRQAMEQHRTPLIKFIGKRHFPKNPPASSTTTTTSTPPPASPPSENSFISYRSKAQQHGPLGHRAAQSQSQFPPPLPRNKSSSSSSSQSQSQRSGGGGGGVGFGFIGNRSGSSLGSVAPSKKGEVFDRSELPRRFWRLEWTEAEIEAVGSGGASLGGV